MSININIKTDYLAFDDNQKIYHNIYLPTHNDVNATLLVVHGMQEHSGRYDIFARFMAERGFAVLTFDLPGHGKTAQNETELGFFRNNQPHELLIDCAHAMAEHLHAQYPSLQHFILAHSMGSFIARCLLQKAPTLFDAAVIVGTGCKAKGASIARMYFALRNALSPQKRTSFNILFKAMNNFKYRNEQGNDGIAWLSIDKENRKKFQADALCGVDFSVNGFYALLTLNVLANKKNWTKKLHPHFPIILLSGANDPIGDFTVGVQKTFASMKNYGMKNVEMKIYSELRHEILQESCKLDIYEYIYNWLNKKTE